MAVVFYQKVFDAGLSGTATAYSLPQFDAPLARAIRWYIFARVTQVTGSTPTLTVNLAHSNTDMGSEFLSLGSTAPINAVALAANAINQKEGSLRYTDSGVAVPGAFVRAEITLGGSNPNAFVEIWITGRDDK